jgi:hypothetical protein
MFLAGFVTGFLLRNSVSLTPIVKLFINKKAKKYDRKYYILAKIHDPVVFNKEFPDVMGGKHRTQPHWDYYPNKQVIKIEITEMEEIRLTSYDDFLEHSGIDIEFFKSFSDLWIYIHHFIDKKEYINVYDNKSEKYEINSKNNVKDDIICAMFYTQQKEYYITKYLKMFQYNNNLTTEHLLLYYDELDRLDATLKIVTSKDIRNCCLKEEIFLKEKIF